jgi:hypothetical protein
MVGGGREARKTGRVGLLRYVPCLPKKGFPVQLYSAEGVPTH